MACLSDFFSSFIKGYGESGYKNMNVKEPIEYIMTLCKGIKESIRSKRPNLTKHYVQELGKTIHALEIEEPVSPFQTWPPISKDTSLDEIINKVEELCLKVLAAIKMGRDDIASNYLYVMYETVCNLEGKSQSYFNEGKEYIN
jgi:hypothetical protein